MNGFSYASLRSAFSLVLAALLVVVSGCDTTPSSRTDRGTDPSSDDAVLTKPDGFSQADLQFDPVSVAPGETFSIALTDEEISGDVTRISHEGTSEGRLALTAQFAPLQPTSVSVECQNRTAGTEKQVATLDPGKLAKDSPVPIALTGDDPTSYHYIERDDNIVVAVDYDGGTAPGGIFRFHSTAEPVSCTHVAFVLNDVSTPLSADGIRFQGIDRQPTVRERRFQ